MDYITYKEERKDILFFAFKLMYLKNWKINEMELILNGKKSFLYSSHSMKIGKIGKIEKLRKR